MVLSMLNSMYKFKLSSMTKYKEGGNMEILFSNAGNIIDGTLYSFLANGISS